MLWLQELGREILSQVNKKIQSPPEPSTKLEEEPLKCQTETQTYPTQPPCGVLGQGNLAWSLSGIARKPGNQGEMRREGMEGAELQVRKGLVGEKDSGLRKSILRIPSPSSQEKGIEKEGQLLKMFLHLFGPEIP